MSVLYELVYRFIRKTALLLGIIVLIVSFVSVYIYYTENRELSVSAVLVSDKYNNIEFEGNNYFIYPMLNEDGSLKHLNVTAYDYENGECSICYINDIAVGVSLDNLEIAEQEYNYLTSQELLSPLEFLDYLLHHRLLYNNSLSLRFWYILIICIVPLSVVAMVNILVEYFAKLNNNKLNKITTILFSALYSTLIILTAFGYFEFYYWYFLK